MNGRMGFLDEQLGCWIGGCAQCVRVKGQIGWMNG